MLFLYVYMCMPECLYVLDVCVQEPPVDIAGTAVIDSGEPACGCWETILGPL